jgi:hypothetical protein
MIWWLMNMEQLAESTFYLAVILNYTVFILLEAY